MTIPPLPRVVGVVPLSDYTLVGLFQDDSLKRFDVAPYIVAGTVFEALNDPARFAEAYVDYGTVVWPGNIDLAPETLYAKGFEVETLLGTKLTDVEEASLLKMLLRSPSRQGLSALILYYETKQ